MLEKLNGDHPIIVTWMLELIVDHITCHDSEICQSLLGRLIIDEDLLCRRIGKSGDFGVGKDLSEVERCRAPSTSSEQYQLMN